ILRGDEAKLANFRAGVAPGRDEVSVGVELLDPVVARVDDVDVPRGVGRQPADRAELPVTATVGAPLDLKGPGGAELLHHVAELVGDVDIYLGAEGDGLGESQHTLGPLGDGRAR